MQENSIRISSLNVELAAIIMKDCIRESREDVAVGGWGLKFLRKDGYCESCKESTGINVIVPAGFHDGPRIGNNNGPSSLVERWTSGGSCDCGGWDLGCPLIVLHAQPTCQDGFGECFSFDLYVQICIPVRIEIGLWLVVRAKNSNHPLDDKSPNDNSMMDG
ncbi:hypothetical protein Tco_0850105 [Tanacetum coccineum]